MAFAQTNSTPLHSQKAQDSNVILTATGLRSPLFKATSNRRTSTGFRWRHFSFALVLGGKKIDFPLIAVMDGEDGGVIRPSSRQMPKVSQKDKSCFLPYFTALSLKQVMFCGLDAVLLSASVPWLTVGNIVLVCNPGKVFLKQEITVLVSLAPFPFICSINTSKWALAGKWITGDSYTHQVQPAEPVI